jgi:hypothetical protein
MAMKHHMEDNAIEWQLKCKIHDVGLCILGCFEEHHTKVRFIYNGGGGDEAYLYIMNITKKGMYIEF